MLADWKVSSVAFSPDGKKIVTGSDDKTARTWDTGTGRELKKLEGHTERVNAVTFSLDGKKIVTVSSDNTARTWDTETGKMMTVDLYEPSGTTVALAPDGKSITLPRDKNIRIINLTDAIDKGQEAKQENVATQYYELGMDYFLGNTVPKDKDKAEFWLSKAAGQGHADAQYRSAKILYDEYHINGNNGNVFSIQVAVKKFHEAANQGHAAAQGWLGICCLEGTGTPKNETVALSWLRLAEKQGDATGQFGLGMAYHKGWGVPQDTKKAIEWYRKAAEQGSAEAQFELGRCYQDGDGIPQNITEAIKWLHKAADQELIYAQVHIGKMYYVGHGGFPMNSAEAVKWFRKAAEQGNADGQYGLYLCYTEGKGVSPNASEAMSWLWKAEQQGHKEAKDRVMRLQRGQ